MKDRKLAQDEVFELCIYNIARLLVGAQDSDIRMRESDVVNFAVGFESIELSANYRLACVVSPEGKGNSLLEIIISMEGVNVKYFLQRDEAMKWLPAV